MTHTIALVGAGGYGTTYLNEFFFNPSESAKLVGVIDPYAEHSPLYDELNSRQIPVFADLTVFYAASHADLVCIASPIHLHTPQTIAALEYGASVLCEKPICATIQDAHRMADAEARSDGFVAIGYQWSFSQAVQALKQDIMQGALGRPVRLKTRVYWPRTDAYFARNRWAARLKTEDGDWVLDSPVNNATAHYLHNMLYVLGAARATSATVQTVQAELYRANPIENYDTAVLRCVTDQNVEVLFYTTHAVQQTVDPIFEYEFENTTVTYDGNGSQEFVAHFADGSQKSYGNPNLDRNAKIWQCVEALDTHLPTACGIAASIPHILCVNGAQESMPAIVNFPASLTHIIRKAGQNLTCVEGLEDLLTACYDGNCLPSESGLADWAAAGKVVDLTDYRHYPKNA